MRKPGLIRRAIADTLACAALFALPVAVLWITAAL